MLREEGTDIERDGLADLLEPSRDIAFADTIHVRDLYVADEAPPPSGPVIVNDPEHGTQCMTPFAYPLPPISADVSLETKLRILSARVRHGLRGSLEEAQDAWSQTRQAPTFVERVKALWSLWQWERGDLVRAALIGCAVFFVVATIGAVAIAGDSESNAPEISARADSNEVRVPRTVDQHTGRAFYPSPVRRSRR